MRPAWEVGWVQWYAPDLAGTTAQDASPPPNPRPGVGLWLGERYAFEDAGRHIDEWTRLAAEAPGSLAVLLDVADVRGQGLRADVFARFYDGLRALCRAPGPPPFERMAIVLPEGPAAAPWRGLHATLPAARVSTCVADRASAWRFLAPAPAVVSAAERTLSDARAHSALLEDVMGHLEANLANGLVATARALSMAPRTLQYELKRRATSFARLRDRVRLQRARDLLLDPDAKIEQVSNSCGFGSRAHFFRWFRAQTGTTPAAWRLERLDGPEATR